MCVCVCVWVLSDLSKCFKVQIRIAIVFLLLCLESTIYNFSNLLAMHFFICVRVFIFLLIIFISYLVNGFVFYSLLFAQCHIVNGCMHKLHSLLGEESVCEHNTCYDTLSTGSL